MRKVAAEREAAVTLEHYKTNKYETFYLRGLHPAVTVTYNNIGYSFFSSTKVVIESRWKKECINHDLMSPLLPLTLSAISQGKVLM